MCRAWQHASDHGKWHVMITKEETKQDINSENNFSLNRELQVEMEQGIQWDCWEQEAYRPRRDVPRASEKQEGDLSSNGGRLVQVHILVPFIRDFNLSQEQTSWGDNHIAFLPSLPLSPTIYSFSFFFISSSPISHSLRDTFICSVIIKSPLCITQVVPGGR